MSHITLITADEVELEAILDESDGDRGGLVLCHPHPEHGGTMRHPMLGAISKRAVAAGYDVLRFNFRGVGESTGVHGHGTDEILDIDAAVARMSGGAVPFVGIAGWSFGAATALVWQARALSTAAYVGIAPPVASPLTPPLPAPEDLRPARRTFIVGDRDQFVDATQLEAYADAIAATTVRYETADHFFLLRHDRLTGDVLAGFES